MEAFAVGHTHTHSTIVCVRVLLIWFLDAYDFIVEKNRIIRGILFDYGM